MTGLADLHQACAALGTILFTVTRLDRQARLYRRIYSSHPQDYPAGGTKPLEEDAYFHASIAPRRAFVANTPAAFAAYFADHDQITALGLGSAANLLVIDPAGEVSHTVNLLARPGHFTPTRLRRYQALVDAAHIGEA